MKKYSYKPFTFVPLVFFHMRIRYRLQKKEVMWDKTKTALNSNFWLLFPEGLSFIKSTVIIPIWSGFGTFQTWGCQGFIEPVLSTLLYNLRNELLLVPFLDKDKRKIFNVIKLFNTFFIIIIFYFVVLISKKIVMVIFIF